MSSSHLPGAPSSLLVSSILAIESASSMCAVAIFSDPSSFVLSSISLGLFTSSAPLTSGSVAFAFGLLDSLVLESCPCMPVISLHMGAHILSVISPLESLSCRDLKLLRSPTMMYPCVHLVMATLIRPGSLRKSDLVGSVLTRLIMIILFSRPWYWFTVCTSTFLREPCLASCILISLTCAVYIANIVMCCAWKIFSWVPSWVPDVSMIHLAMSTHSLASPMLEGLEFCPFCLISLSWFASSLESLSLISAVSVHTAVRYGSFHIPDSLFCWILLLSISLSVLIWPL